MSWVRVVLGLVAAVAAGVLLVSGGSGADPRTPVGLPGLPAPFLGTAVVGEGQMTAAVDAYGDVVDLRARPGGTPLIAYSSARQSAGTVPSDTGIVPWVAIGSGPPRPLWRADSVSQRYLPQTNVVRTAARFGRVRVVVTDAATGRWFGRIVAVSAPRGLPVRLNLQRNLQPGVRCEQRLRAPGEFASDREMGGLTRTRVLELGCSVRPGALRAAADVIAASTARGRRWLARARPLGPAAPPWARRLYARSLLTLRALTDSRSGASVAGARDGWAYVWPRDAATAALAFDAAGYRSNTRKVAGYLLRLDLAAGARFYPNGGRVPGRPAQGDAQGWVRVAAQAAGSGAGAMPPPLPRAADYWEGEGGSYLGNAVAELRFALTDPAARARELTKTFGTPRGLVREAGEPGSGLDSAAAWAVRPFPVPPLYPRVRQTLLTLLRHGTRFGITPGEAWPGQDPWTAPTAWSAWSLAALGGRRAAIRLLADLRRAATPAGALPERVDARTGVPRSTTPLAWSHAFAILALRELWPKR